MQKETASVQRIHSYKDLRVYQAAIDGAMRIFELTKRFPADERYSMVTKCGARQDPFARI